MTSGRPTGRDASHGRIPLVLRLLDHQVIGHEGQLLGNVDDLVLRDTDDGLVVAGLLSGPEALAMRQGGRTGAWLYAAWRRLDPEPDPQPVGVSLDHVLRLDSAVHVDEPASHHLANAQGLELWLREHVVSHLPGALGADSDPDHPSADADTDVGEPLSSDEHTVSGLLGLPVVTEDGSPLGEVIEVVGTRTRRGKEPLGPVRVTELVCTRRRLGQELGYTMEPQRPQVVQWLLRAWHRGDRHVRLEDVEIDWSAARVLVRAGVELRHPHDVD